MLAGGSRLHIYTCNDSSQSHCISKLLFNERIKIRQVSPTSKFLVERLDIIFFFILCSDQRVRWNWMGNLDSYLICQNYIFLIKMTL